MNTEQVDAHVEALDLSAMAPGGANHFTPAEAKASPATVISKVCSIYQSVRPIISTVSELFFVPKKWRDSMKAYMAVMDGLCPA